MILLLDRDLTPQQRAELAQCLRREGLDRAETLAQLEAGEPWLELLSSGDPKPDLVSRARIWPGVRKVLTDRLDFLPRVTAAEASVSVPSRRASAPDICFDDTSLVVIAGPCTVDEDPAILVESARAVRAAGATMLRAGAFKPRTSPYSFQGRGREGLLLLGRVASDLGLPIVTEVMDPRDVDFVAQHAELLQIGARSMQNYALLQEAGRAGRPILLKRGPAATLDEWLAAAEYCFVAGAPGVVLCERGLRSFDPSRRNLLDLSVIPAVRKRCSLPVVIDPSHATGVRSYVPPMARAAVAAGADGVMVEVHPCAAHAPSDPEQALALDELEPLVYVLRQIAELEGRRVVSASAQRAAPEPDGLASSSASHESPHAHKSRAVQVDETRGTARAARDLGRPHTS